jgi:N-acetylglucosaminyldiphosphoundecaprenol N-acetyl-beta-D-mannosaminyltransferase
MMKVINIWGIKIDPLSKNEIVDLVDQHINQEKRMYHLTGVNPETITQAQENPALRKAINSSDIVNIDNMLVVTFLRLLRYKIPERAACPDIFEQLLARANVKGYSVYFLGAKEEILQLMIEKLRIKYPRLIIAGSRNGYFDAGAEPIIVKEINRLKPDMLFIALPTPQKELFIDNNREKLGTRLAFGVGGAFDVQAGKVKRAPKWLRRIGLEGIHRAIQNPGNYGNRYTKYYVPFCRLFVRELLGKPVTP